MAVHPDPGPMGMMGFARSARRRGAARDRGPKAVEECRIQGYAKVGPGRPGSPSSRENTGTLGKAGKPGREYIRRMTWKFVAGVLRSQLSELTAGLMGPQEDPVEGTEVYRENLDRRTDR